MIVGDRAVCRTSEVGERASDPSDPVVAASGQASSLELGAQQSLGIVGERTIRDGVLQLFRGQRLAFDRLVVAEVLFGALAYLWCWRVATSTFRF